MKVNDRDAEMKMLVGECKWQNKVNAQEIVELLA